MGRKGNVGIRTRRRIRSIGISLSHAGMGKVFRGHTLKKKEWEVGGGIWTHLSGEQCVSGPKVTGLSLISLALRWMVV